MTLNKKNISQNNIAKQNTIKPEIICHCKLPPLALDSGIF